MISSDKSNIPPDPATLNHRYVVGLCGLLMALSAFSVDILLPFFGQIAQGLSVPIGQLPTVVTVFIFCMGTGQLVSGIVSDRYGRKPVMGAGIVLFLVGSAIACFAQSLAVLLLARALQGFGVSAATTLSRAMLRDLYTGPELARRFAVATAMFSVGPIVAPLLGALLLAAGGHWRLVFVVMALYGLALLVGMRRLPETLPQFTPISRSTLWRSLGRVFRHTQSRNFLVINAVSSTAMILIIACMAPLYAQNFEISGSEFAVYYAFHGTGIIIGQLANHRLIGTLGLLPTTILAVLVMLLAAMLIVTVALLEAATPVIMSLLVTMFALGYLSLTSNALSMTLMPHGEIAGLTAALQGASGLALAALFSGLIAPLVQEDFVAWGAVIATCNILALALLLRWQRHQLRREILSANIPS